MSLGSADLVEAAPLRPVLPTSGDMDNLTSDPAEDVRKQSRRRRVPWMDSTLRRDAWRCQHVSVSGSLRSVQVGQSDFARTVFLARQDLPARGPAGPDTRRVVDMWNKLLCRGDEPPIHPDSERSLLLEEGFSEDELIAARLPGDISPRLRRNLQLELGLPQDIESRYDQLTGSDLEEEFLAWLALSHPELTPFLTPQASFDMLLTARGSRSPGCRRVDFLLSLPDGTDAVIEIDGLQHQGQTLSDADRDSALAKVGISTVRIGSSEIKARSGENLRKLANFAHRLREAHTEPVFPSLPWAAILLHRFAFALGEAVVSGFVSGPRWIISLEDPTHRLSHLLGPYLEMFWALDRLWGGSKLSPEYVTLIDGEDRVGYQRNGAGDYLPAKPSDEAADFHLVLDVVVPPMAVLTPHPSLPTIITRTASIGVSVSRPPSGGAGRVAARISAKEIQAALKVLLRGIFAMADFRPGQCEAVTELISGRDCCVLLPTGAGKSLIYQLAGLCLPGRTLVIDPLVSLIEDQVNGLATHGIDRAVGVTSQSTRSGQTDALLREIADADAYFIFVAPERLQMSNFRNSLRELAAATPINLAVIDEAHCVSEWGHQFRTSYLGLGQVIRSIARDVNDVPPPLVALTGTASRAVLRDVLFQLEIKEGTVNTIIRPATFDRKELSYRIIRCTPGEAEASLRSTLKTLPTEFNESVQTFFAPDGESTYSGLVFVPTVNGTKSGVTSTSEIVSDVCNSVAIYSGSAPKGVGSSWDQIKRQNATAFRDNRITCLVATNAFGMGIDKPNIRWVVHYGLSSSIESYYQEVGRAGRNGEPAQCVLILKEFDKVRNSQLLAEDLGLEDARKRSGALKWSDGDDVTTAVYFHLTGFRGTDFEVDALTALLDQLKPNLQRQRVEIPFDTMKIQERGLHRLRVLGVVDDYLVEHGSMKFDVSVDASDSEKVKRALLAFVERTQPGRVAEFESRLDAIKLDHHGTIVRCGRLLIDFVYETVEKSRRRSLREMLLAARTCDSDESFRTRILDYLSEGDVGNSLEALVDLSSIDLATWRLQWEQIGSRADAAEWRASAARLLASYPDHPGLLLTRGLTEILDADVGEVPWSAVDEYVLNLEAALQSATPLYRVSREQMRNTVSWLVDRIRTTSRAAVAATISVAERHDVAGADARSLLRGQAADDLASAIVYIDQTLIELFHVADSINIGGSK